MKRNRDLVWAFCGSIFCMSCADPPGYGNLRINLDRLAASSKYSAMDMTVSTIELYYNTEGPAVEPGYQICNYQTGTIIAPENGIAINLDVKNTGRTYVAGFPVPAGKLSEIRLFMQDLRVIRDKKEQVISTELKCKGDYGSRTASTQDHSGKKAAADKDKFAILRLVPGSHVPIDIVPDATTEVTGLFLPARDLSNDADGNERRLTDKIDLVQIAQQQQGALLPDELVVQFAQNLSREQITQIVQSRSTGVARALFKKNYYTIKLPTGTDLKKEIEFYHSRPDVEFVLPNTLLSGLYAPPEYASSRQPSLLESGVESAWNVNNASGSPNNSGSYKPIIAVIDSGFDLANPDIWPNIYINSAEIPRDKISLVGDRNLDGRNDVKDLDFDNDGFITFSDLNALVPIYRDLCKIDRSPPFDKCNPLDLVNGATTILDVDKKPACKSIVDVPAEERLWQDGVDNDNNDYCDDLIGWNFSNQTNVPTTSSSHGTEVAGIIGAADNGIGLVGVSGRSRLLPLQATREISPTIGEMRILRDLVMHAMDYAGKINTNDHADVINLSAGFIATRDGSGITECRGNPDAIFEPNVEGSKLDQFITESYKEFRKRQIDSLGGSLLVNAAGNCSLENQSPASFADIIQNAEANAEDVSGIQVLSWPSIFNARGLRVGGASSGYSGRWPKSAYGTMGTDLMAIANGFKYLHRSDYQGTDTSLMSIARSCVTEDSCAGTSLSSGLVSGTAGLLISSQQMSLPACEVANIIMKAADSIPTDLPIGSFSGALNAGQALRKMQLHIVNKCR